MAITARVFHNAIVLVITGHCLVTISLAALLHVTLNFHPQLPLHTTAFRKDAVGPVAHWLGIVFVAWAVLGLTQRIHLMVFALVSLFTLTCKQHVKFNMLKCTACVSF